MKKIALLFCALTAVILSGCFETTVEITVNEDGSGTVTNTSDMSKMIGIAKQAGGGEEMEKAADANIDTVFSLAKGADSIPNLTPAEIAMAKEASVRVKVNMKDEQFISAVSFPFHSPGEIEARNKLSGKILNETIKSQMGGDDGDAPIPGMDEMGTPTTIDDYYEFSFSKGKLTRKLNKEKYAKLADDTYLKTMKQGAEMGLDMTITYVINLPYPAKKTEGKGVVLSSDKKKVTIKGSIDDLYDAPDRLEFEIEY
jgi:hypothetical protein